MPAKKKTGKSVMLPWQQQLAAYAKGGKKLKEKVVQSTYISAKGAKYRVDGGKARNELTGVILEACLERTFYDQPYTEGESNIPSCFALSYELSDVVPHTASVHKESSDCATCELAEWMGDAPPECTERRRLAMIVQTDEGETVLRTLSLPPTSLKNWREFYKDIIGQGFELMQMSVVISFDEDSSMAYPPMLFEAVKEIKNAKQLEELVANMPKAQELLEQGYDASGYKDYSKKKGTKKKGTKKKGAKKKGTKKKSKFSL